MCIRDRNNVDVIIYAVEKSLDSYKFNLLQNKQVFINQLKSQMCIRDRKERFRYFIKVPELAKFYAEITDYKTAEDVGVDRPELNEQLYHIPGRRIYLQMYTD